MCEPDDEEDDIVSAAILCCERNQYITDVWLIYKLNLLPQQLNFLLLLIDPSNFHLILKYFI